MHEAAPLFHHRQFDPLLVASSLGTQRISVCIPARNEERTVGAVVGAVHRTLTEAGGGIPLVDELVVVDDGSTDATADEARRAGARVVPGSGRGGKGAAMAAGAAATAGDVVVFLDADVENFGPHFVTGLVGPFLSEPAVVLVKAFYDRPLGDDPSGGGRVTELVARPLVALLFPELGGIRQPLAGETAIRRSVLEAVTLEPGYGVELGLLVDVAEMAGVDAIAQVDLGTRVHRNRPLDELRAHATEVLRAGLARAGAQLTR